MANYCEICGRELKKSSGPIGPTCMKKFSNKNLTISHKVSDELRLKYLKKHDIFGDEDGQTKDAQAGTNSQTQASV